MGDETVRWLTADQLRAWIRLESVVELLPAVLDSQLQHDAQLTHFEYLVLAKLSEAPEHVLRMTHLAAVTNATLPRLSHVVSRLESRGYLERVPCREDRRATNAQLTEAGWHKVVATAPGHVENVRAHVIDLLSEEQIGQLDEIMQALLQKLDPQNSLRRLP
jgi:DNA-binding MarR family transcriptional regulator